MHAPRDEWAEFCTTSRQPTFKLHLYLDLPPRAPAGSRKGSSSNSRGTSGEHKLPSLPDGEWQGEG